MFKLLLNELSTHAKESPLEPSQNINKSLQTPRFLRRMRYCLEELGKTVFTTAISLRKLRKLQKKMIDSFRSSFFAFSTHLFLLLIHGLASDSKG